MLVSLSQSALSQPLLVAFSFIQWFEYLKKRSGLWKFTELERGRRPHLLFSLFLFPLRSFCVTRVVTTVRYGYVTRMKMSDCGSFCDPYRASSLFKFAPRTSPPLFLKAVITFLPYLLHPQRSTLSLLLTMFRPSSLLLCLVTLWCAVVVVAQQEEVSEFKESRDTPFSCDEVIAQSFFDPAVSTCCSLKTTPAGACVLTVVNGRCKVRMCICMYIDQ